MEALATDEDVVEAQDVGEDRTERLEDAGRRSPRDAEAARLEPAAHQGEVLDRIEVAGVGARGTQGVGFDHVVELGAPSEEGAAVGERVADAAVPQEAR